VICLALLRSLGRRCPATGRLTLPGKPEARFRTVGCDRHRRTSAGSPKQKPATRIRKDECTRPDRQRERRRCHRSGEFLTGHSRACVCTGESRCTHRGVCVRSCWLTADRCPREPWPLSRPKSARISRIVVPRSGAAAHRSGNVAAREAEGLRVNRPLTRRCRESYCVCERSL
jgi:hypothetical protein